MEMVAAKDTLFGYLNSSIGGTSAEVASSTWASEHAGYATVQEWVYPSTRDGQTEWQDQPALTCHSWEYQNPYCSLGESYSVYCQGLYGAGVKANATFDALYTNGAVGDGSGDTEKSCSPDYNGGNSSSGGYDSSCDTYIVEESDDGGNTWYEINRLYACS